MLTGEITGEEILMRAVRLLLLGIVIGKREHRIQESP
jgi:hypothetical protein